MTATFGKLEHETLTLEPGLNIITAPNEWGKSTWCAFLVAMLYGLDTRAKTTKSALADKERYAPWSGAPMEGRINLNWQGRDITIERRTKRRIPLGEFRAYETASGLAVEELTAANCGQMLLGVEQTVFRRAGFIRNGDLPVTQDEALRRRLNSLVTSGDESGAADKLADNLKDLKNRCRYNRSGLLPQAEREREEIRSKLGELSSMELQCAKLNTRLEEVRDWMDRLNNHKQAMAFAAAQANAGRMAEAEAAMSQARQELAELEKECEDLPSREEAERMLRKLKELREQWNDILMERQMLPQLPEEPWLAQPFTGMTEEEARKMARQDGEQYAAAVSGKMALVLVILGVLGLAGTGLLAYLKVYIPAAVSGVTALISFVWGICEFVLAKKRREALLAKYGSPDWKHWADPIDDYEAAQQAYRQAVSLLQASDDDIDQRCLMLEKEKQALCGEETPEACMEYWHQVQRKWDNYHDVRREAIRAQSHFDAIGAVVRPVDPPAAPDTLEYSEGDTARLLSDAVAEQQRLVGRLGQYRGWMESLGDRSPLEQALEEKNQRIARLEEIYSALSIAQETLADARAELQRRFAPGIVKRAEALMACMTGGRYQRLSMAEDFSLRAGAGEEDTLRESLWRSDGTMDQLYLALRLAVAEKLTPEAPLVLDDALVRFDDRRMAAAVELLREMAKDKQVICFTCQSREAELSALQ